jgi:hypothetical protein
MAIHAIVPTFGGSMLPFKLAQAPGGLDLWERQPILGASRDTFALDQRRQINTT